MRGIAKTTVLSKNKPEAIFRFIFLHYFDIMWQVEKIILLKFQY